MRDIGRFVEDLVRSRRPRRLKGGEKEVNLIRTAIGLRAARPGSGAPRDEFVLGLHRRLAAELDPPGPRPARGGRRAFIRAAALAGGAAAAGAGIDHSLTSHAAAAAPEASIVPDPAAWLTVATSSDVPEGTALAFTADGVAGFVRRTGGRLQAVSGICTHQGCRLTLATGPATGPATASAATAPVPRLVCPCHGATFALDGAVLSHRLHMTLTALPRLAVREANGDVQVFAPARPAPAQSSGR